FFNVLIRLAIISEIFVICNCIEATPSGRIPITLSSCALQCSSSVISFSFSFFSKRSWYSFINKSVAFILTTLNLIFFQILRHYIIEGLSCNNDFKNHSLTLRVKCYKQKQKNRSDLNK